MHAGLCVVIVNLKSVGGPQARVGRGSLVADSTRPVLDPTRPTYYKKSNSHYSFSVRAKFCNLRKTGIKIFKFLDPTRLAGTYKNLDPTRPVGRPDPWVDPTRVQLCPQAMHRSKNRLYSRGRRYNGM
jgi:hypothetical protein